MLDFMTIATRRKSNNVIEIYPKFILKKTTDLMTRGGDFYAVWVEDRGLWSTDEHDVIQLIDRELSEYYNKKTEEDPDFTGYVCYMWDSESGSIDSWHRYCQKQMRDSFVMLDEKLIFSNTETTKTDYASKRLSYPLEPGSITSYEKLISTLYSEEERHKIEWAIGSIVCGDSKKIQKFMVLYGAAGTGKSTILNIIQQLFEGYYSVFDAKALGSSNSSFALESFKTNPLVAIQHDGDLSRIEDNTRLNSLVSHELMTVNEKFKSAYSNDFKAFLFMGTNKPVRITDGKSGLLRRLIDVTPSGNKLTVSEYMRAVKQIKFELGAIAYHCQEVYLSNPGKYDDYTPKGMMGATNDFYNYVINMYSTFKREDGTSLRAAWEAYKVYCDDAKVPNSYSQRYFKEELKNYFKEFDENFAADDGKVTSYYSGFRTEKFEDDMRPAKAKSEEPAIKLIKFEEIPSIFDDECADCFAQYASSEETPLKAWDNVKSKLSSLDTSVVHYVRVPENHIVIDFDIKDADGNKCLAKNIEEASKWPATYAELSKSGAGVHLHYIYNGDVNKLSRVYDDNIEVKVFTGKTALRRKLTKCNDLPIATISSGLPLRGDEKLVNWDGIKNEKMLRIMIKKNLNKEYHAYTKPSVEYIHTLLNLAYNSGIPYDVTDLKNAIFAFAANSNNNSDFCIKLVGKMKFKSEEKDVGDIGMVDEEAPLVFYDVEVFPNLFLVNWKIAGEGKQVVRMINPKPSDIEELTKFRLVGFNCRRYDNHMLYACLIGYSNEQIYELSQKIINAKKGENRDAFFGPAYNISYTDVYDFAAKKQSLKKWEIELGIHHQELGLPWDEPVPEDQWIKVAEYCDNDVLATEAVFNHLKGDFTARQILADLAGATVNDTTNSLTTKIIFGNNRNPKLVYTDLATGEQYY
jgi:energy-coupling factor transporter ATP-binding protein EcfA2